MVDGEGGRLGEATRRCLPSVASTARNASWFGAVPVGVMGGSCYVAWPVVGFVAKCAGATMGTE